MERTDRKPLGRVKKTFLLDENLKKNVLLDVYLTERVNKPEMHRFKACEVVFRLTFLLVHAGYYRSVFVGGGRGWAHINIIE